MNDQVSGASLLEGVVLPSEELFEAGPERGGRHIGGPFWTDFKVLQKEYDQQHASSSGVSGGSGTGVEGDVAMEMMQVVGHTAQHGSFRGTR
jgi:hypothetical protein